MLTTLDIIAARTITAAALERQSPDPLQEFKPLARPLSQEAEDGMKLSVLAARLRAVGFGAHISVKAATHVRYYIPAARITPAKTVTYRTHEQQKAAYEAAEEKRQRKCQARVIASGGTVEGDF